MATYTDKPLSFSQQIALLKQKGLSFADEQKALHLLQQNTTSVYFITCGAFQVILYALHYSVLAQNRKSIYNFRQAAKRFIVGISNC